MTCKSPCNLSGLENLLKFNSLDIKDFLVNHISYSDLKKSRRVQKRVIEGPVDTDQFIYRQLKEKKELLIGRLGGIEAHCLGLFLDRKRGIRSPIRLIRWKLFVPRRRSQLCSNAGVYPNTKEMFNFFCEEHLEALNNVDIFSVWAKPFSWVESEVLNNKKEVIVISPTFSYPWFDSRDAHSEFGWAYAFEGKKILVISPFEQSLNVQILKMNSIFSGIKIPNMKFEVMQAPLSQGGLDDGLSYREHLMRLKRLMEEKNFDIALISAGAYSLPLAAHAKKMGKIGIHGGGITQIFFGITGKRFDNYVEVQKYFNASWKRPETGERPQNWEQIEDGCYW